MQNGPTGSVSDKEAALPAGPALDSGLIALLMMAEFHGLAADRAQLRHQYGEAPFDTITLLHAAQSLGFTARSVRQPPERLHKAPLPCIALDGEGRFFILAKIDTGQSESGADDTNARPGKNTNPRDT